MNPNRIRRLATLGPVLLPMLFATSVAADEILGPPPVAAIRLAQATPSPSAAAEDIFWQSIQNSTDPAMFQAYLDQVSKGAFPGTYKALADLKIAALKGGVAPTVLPKAAEQTAASAPEVEACDRAAAHPFDPDKPANLPGVEVKEIAPGAALRACLTAAALPDAPRRVFFELGRAYERSGNRRDALAQYAKAADLGHGRSLFNMGLTTVLGGNGVRRDYSMARGLLERSVDAGVADAYVQLGWMYHNGQGLKRDYAKALDYFQKGQDAGSIIAYSAIASLYRQGHGVPRDTTKACQFDQQGAAKGDVDASTNIKRYCHFNRG